MSVALSFDLDGLSPKEAKVLASMILAYVETKYGEEAMGVRELPEFPDVNVPKPSLPDPASVFPLQNEILPGMRITDGNRDLGVIGGNASKLSNAGPVLMIPNPPPPSQTNVALDSAGLPWDNRIHASTKTTNTDGKWKKRKGVDAAEVTAVEAQLRQVLAIPSVSPPPSAPPVASVVPPPPVDENAMQQAYIDLWSKSQAAIASGAIGLDQIKTICESVGIAGLPLLALRLDLVPRVSQLIDAVIKGQG